MLTFIKRTATSWQHDNGTVKSSFGGGIPITNDTDNTIIFQLPNGTNFPKEAVLIKDCKIIDKTDSDAEYSFPTTTEFLDKLEELGYPYINTGGGGGGAGTNLGYTPSASNGIVTSSTGTDATIPLADGTTAGLSENNVTDSEKSFLLTAGGLSLADYAKLDTSSLENYTTTTDMNTLLGAKSDKELHLYQETDRNLSNATGAQNIFDTSTVSMLANSVYRFTLEFNMTGLSGTTNALNYIQLAFDAGTVGVSVFQYRVIGVKANQASSSTPQISSFNSTSLINVVLNTTATEGKIFVSGSIKTSTAGTFQPQVGMGVASSGVVKAGATFVAKILN